MDELEREFRRLVDALPVRPDFAAEVMRRIEREGKASRRRRRGPRVDRRRLRR